VFFDVVFQKCANWGELSPKSAGFEPLFIVNPFAAVSNRSKAILARKCRMTSALLKGVKKVGRRKGNQANGLCSRAGLQSTEEWRFWDSKKRHFSPFFPCSFGSAASLGAGLRTASGAKGTRWWLVPSGDDETVVCGS
jgi:hypothetical protein